MGYSVFVEDQKKWTGIASYVITEFRVMITMNSIALKCSPWVLMIVNSTSQKEPFTTAEARNQNYQIATIWLHSDHHWAADPEKASRAEDDCYYSTESETLS